jgi:hypothetical protein
MTQALKSLFASLKLNHDYKEVFNSPQGQRVLADILKRAGVTRPQFEADPEKARFLEGHRHLAHSIFRMVHSSDEPLLKLIAEEQNKQEQHVTHYN